MYTNNNIFFLQGNNEVSLAFCLVYTTFTWSSLCMLPWTLFLLSWHLFLAGRRETTLLNLQPVMEFGTLVPMTTAGLFVETEVLEGADGRPTRHQKRMKIKARKMDDGPRKPQQVILIFMWIGRLPDSKGCNLKSFYPNFFGSSFFI